MYSLNDYLSGNQNIFIINFFFRMKINYNYLLIMIIIIK